jgi:DNA polymerase-3 subunit epsilon
MDLQAGGDGDDATGTGIAIADILVLPPTADELAEHESLLQTLDKEAKGACLWRQLGAASGS